MSYTAEGLQYAVDVVRASRLILALFLILQICDGVFTYVAVSAVGLGAEGNVLLATWMGLIGPGATLLAAKTLAVAAGLLVYYRGLHAVLAGLTVFYSTAAVGPWLVVFATWP
jgi:hypothetical protein